VQQPDSDRAVAQARDRFFATTEKEPASGVRRMILASWQRSRENDVGIDRIRVPYLRDPDLEAPLCRSASPILDTLGEQLQSEAISIILTDHTGMVLDRRSSGVQINNRLDQVRLAPGFSYAEEFAGTNGIGTSLSSGRATFVDGREHYTDELRQFACAGSPIRHPTRGKVIGLLDLTSWSHSPGAMLMALASATARQIEQELLAQTGMRELALFSEYMKVCRQSKGPVLALNNDVVMTNNELRQLLDPPEHESLISYAIDTMQSGRSDAMRTVELPSGRTAYLRYTLARCDNGPAGGVFRIRIGHVVEPEGLVLPQTTRGSGTLNLPGLVGSGAVWHRCVQQVDSRYRAGDWMALEGEPGTGKRSLLRAVHRLHNPAGHFRVLQPPSAEDFEPWLAALADDLAVPDALLVLAEAERFTDDQAAAVGDLLIAASADTEPHSRVAITINATTPAALRAVFPRTVDVPPLRHHLNDLAQLIPHLLSQIPDGDRLTCSPAAMAQLSRLNWPGNIAQLRGVLLYVIQHRRTGLIEVVDLPPECRSTSRRVLSPIEALERDAIVNALRDKSESPTTAAKNLGMSRATIYRKIRQYDITLS
jgi:transcriptional regulator of acetoin/glycerol metabolism